MKNMIHPIFGSLSEEELEAYKRVLEKVRKNVEEMALLGKRKVMV